MEIGKIFLGAAGAVECFLIGCELNEIARYKPGGKTQISENLDRKPGRVTAASRSFGETGL